MQGAFITGGGSGVGLGQAKVFGRAVAMERFLREREEQMKDE